MGTTVHCHATHGLISVAIRKVKIYHHDCCPLPMPLPNTNLKNIVCRNGCCAAIYLSNQDRKPDYIVHFSISVKHLVYFYMIYPNSIATGQRVVSFDIYQSSFLMLKMIQPIQSSPSHNCLGREVDSVLVEYASNNFDNGLIMRSYASKKQIIKSTYVGRVVNDAIHYDRYNNEVFNENDLCQNCLTSREWLKNHMYEMKKKRKHQQEGGVPSKKKVKLK